MEYSYKMLEPIQQFNSLNLEHLEYQYVPTSDDLKHGYNPFHLNSFQYYQPVLKLLFDINQQNYDSMQLNHRYHINDLTTVIDTRTQELMEKPIFIKYSPLLDPIRYMIGRYDTESSDIRTLPTLDGANFAKLADTNNASYVDGFFCLLSSKLMELQDFKHSIDYYGSFSAVQKKFKMNIADDYEYLNSSNFFLDNVNKLFRINKGRVSSISNHNSRGNRNKLVISSEDDIITDVAQIDLAVPELELSALEEVYVQVKDEAAKESSDDEDDTSDDEDDTSDDEEEDDDEEDEEEDDEDASDEEDDDEEWEDEDEDEGSEASADEPAIFAYVDNFPVQMICLEKCDGTLDELFVNDKIDEDTGASALFQIIMTLLAYQTAYKFTHNDLHTNNIMYVSTNEQFLYYKYNNISYKVPTYGRIFKIIDFGRSIYTYKGKTFCSDSFAPGGDAATQYNFEPYYNSKHPVIEPNYSFDLCRLGCSIHDFIIGEKPRDELQKTIHRWCLDDKKVSVLYKKNGDERYPDFKLYKMIAKTVHAHTPQKQLTFPFFSQFKTEQVLSGVACMDIGNIPSYA
jgi:hypothetical protein